MNNKIKKWLRLLFTNPLKLSKIWFKILWGIIKRIKINFLYNKHIIVVNNWERYDPLLSPWVDTSHLTRYNFAKKYISKEDTVLDIACWTWYWTEILAKECKNIYGVDISQDAIDYARKKRKQRNMEFILNDLYENKITADIVVSFETIEHIPNKSIEETIEKLLKYTNKSLIWSYPYKEVSWNNKHHFHFNLDENQLNEIKSKYKIDFFYQDTDWVIKESKKNRQIQNLIFIIYK